MCDNEIIQGHGAIKGRGEDALGIESSRMKKERDGEFFRLCQLLKNKGFNRGLPCVTWENGVGGGSFIG